MTNARVLKVAIDTPLRHVFDYWAPQVPGRHPVQPGVRVQVPFGRRRAIGIVTAIATEPAIARSKLRPADAVLDAEPLFDADTFELLLWAARYYHHPVGEVLAAALPATLRRGAALLEVTQSWRITDEGLGQGIAATAKKARRQNSLLTRLLAEGAIRADELGAWRESVRELARRGWIELVEQRAVVPHGRPLAIAAGPALNDDQQAALDAITASLGDFTAHVIFGVTGSGKTEVYLRAIETVVRRGQQALVLVPEISLTPQLLTRFRERFTTEIAVLHSALSDGERFEAWRKARSGEAPIVIGTRSAVLAPLARLGLIVVDEEHDASYRQQEGFRYSARDFAVARAQRLKIPVVLGSATPSLETLANADQGRYRLLRLPTRTGSARPPVERVVDLRAHATEQGLATPTLAAIREHLGRDAQVLVFLNRRGYAPALFCTTCGWMAPCRQCDSRMTVHLASGRLRCHHCGAEERIPALCGSCQGAVKPVGQGTQRLQETLARLFPSAPIVRLDRDSVSRKGEMQTAFDRVTSGEARLLVGTQMLTKGHHFPDVTLVVVLDADQGLFSADYRAAERLAQTITQVAGRAGRAERPGEVLIQTLFPDQPLLTQLIAHGYAGFARSALEERRESGWPPFRRLALLRAESTQLATAEEFLASARRAAGRVPAGIELLGPAPAAMPRKANRYRAQLLVECASRGALQSFLDGWVPRIDALKRGKLRWSLEVDPAEVL
ncbi:MAG TPA: primosomal protein N' [Steroidobacteraceae bacterium]|nr:primosomal protein N' [Steroidobacteraceae bacterium]